MHDRNVHSACVVWWGKCWAWEQCRHVRVCMCFRVGDDENCMVWCLAREVCGRMWEETLAKPPSVHATSRCWSSHFSGTLPYNICLSDLHVSRPRTLRELITVSLPRWWKLVKDLGRRIQIWAFTLNRLIVEKKKKKRQAALQNSTNSHYPRAMIESSVSQGFAEILSGSLACLETIPGEKTHKQKHKHTLSHAQMFNNKTQHALMYTVI